ncbi:hypothetical protein C5Y96_12205 [Blastopirellula marina]|uniref:Uncharacterized protein n=1 Tax=Blastopirellula marina TaxID=124 RepID=A0A2S8FG16_9BACT|nr:MULTISPECIES: hypothetical protein [Pirellulaceae]PQO31113.1 hypothetical protein C5Y96_12205 [Blastopirellula marina]RCS51507.1 hypothetical protein DTL36_12215 [Bremerella cremea]
MRDEPFRHDALKSSEGLSAVTIYKLMVGTLLIVAGVALGIYVANATLELIYGEVPPPLIARIQDIAAEKAAAEAANQNVPEIKLAPDLMQAILYALTFFFLTIPIMVASMLMGAGVKLMQGEANEAIAMLAERLKKTER